MRADSPEGPKQAFEDALEADPADYEELVRLNLHRREEELRGWLSACS
jgi:hypothetical protein